MPSERESEFGYTTSGAARAETVRLSDLEIEKIAELGADAAALTTMAWDPDASSEDRQREEGLERQRRVEAMEKFKTVLLERESEAFKRGSDLAIDKEARRQTNARSIVLFLVVLAVVLMPVLAIIKGLDSDVFGTYIAPITGIAGTVVGFWFSTVDRKQAAA